MQDEASLQLIRRLSLAAGAPGAEDEVRAIVREQLAEVGPIRYDGLGSLICEKKGESDAPRVALDCHLDEVAFMVQRITDEGRLTFVPLGGWWGHVLLGQRVEVITEQGRVPGVIGSTPPHFLTPEERKRVVDLKKMYVDLGASRREDAEGLGIRPGDPVIPVADFREMAVEGVYSGKALDNRLGVAAMCEVMNAMRDEQHAGTLVGIAAVQEEVGLRGAGTASALAKPDVGIVLECAPADDLPGQTERQGVLDGGPQIRLFDPTAISNRRLVRFTAAVAAECGIKIQLAVRPTGGTNAGAIHKSGTGVPTVVIAVPGRYIHSHVSLFHWNDYVGARKLALELARRLDADRVRELTRFD